MSELEPDDLPPYLAYLLVTFQSLRQKARKLAREDDGLTTLEVAVIAAGLLLVAVGLVAIITTAVGNHDSKIK